MVEHITNDGTVLRYGSRFRPITPDGAAALLELVRNVTGDSKARFYSGPTAVAPRNWLDAPVSRPQKRPIYSFSITYQGRVSFMSFEYDSGEEYVLVFYRGQLDCMCRDEFDERFTTGKERNRAVTLKNQVLEQINIIEFLMAENTPVGIQLALDNLKQIANRLSGMG
jgi:hypothetical protein